MLASLREFGELKRIRSASRAGSVGERLFLASWSALHSGLAIVDVMASCIAATAAAAHLGDIDFAVLLDLGITRQAAGTIIRKAAASTPSLSRFFDSGPLPHPGRTPQFAHLLALQPRAGITCPGKPRILLEPPENHAEHCLAVAVYAVALSTTFDADPTVVWLAGLSHHLHNAFLPDAGFSGEVLLAEHLEPIMLRARERALAELDLPLRDAVRAALEIVPDADTPEGRAFHAADTLDRVWQIDQHLRAARLDLDFVLNDMELIHAGPVKRFQDEVLQAARVLA